MTGIQACLIFEEFLFFKILFQRMRNKKRNRSDIVSRLVKWMLMDVDEYSQMSSRSFVLLSCKSRFSLSQNQKTKKNF